MSDGSRQRILKTSLDDSTLGSYAAMAAAATENQFTNGMTGAITRNQEGGGYQEGGYQEGGYQEDEGYQDYQ